MVRSPLEAQPLAEESLVGDRDGVAHWEIRRSIAGEE